ILVSSLTAAFYLFDLGFASAVTRFVARYISKKENDRVNEVISSSFAIYSALATVIVLASAIAASLAPNWTETEDNAALVQSLILVMRASDAVEFAFKSFAGVATSYMRYDLLSYSRIFFKLVSATATIILVLNGLSLIAIALVSLISSLLSNITFFYIARHLHKEMRVSFRHANRTTIRELFSYSAWAFLIDMTT